MGNGISESRMPHRRALVKRSPTLHTSGYVYSTTAANSKAREQKLQLDRYWIESSMDIPRCVAEGAILTKIFTELATSYTHKN